MKPCEICRKLTIFWIVYNDSGCFPFCCDICLKQIMKIEAQYGGQYFIEEIKGETGTA